MRSYALRRGNPPPLARSIARQGAARQTRADKARAYAIALCECCEACAAVEIAGALGACSAGDVQAVVALGTRTKNILSRLVR